MNTLYQLNILNSTDGLLLALLIGIAFGICLEIAGFGSSKILAGVFYFRDLRVIKVMMSAMLTAMIGLAFMRKTGLVPDAAIYVLPTFYLAAIIGGLIFGIGFVAGGWCPGTAVVGLAAGKVDAAIFMIGNLLGILVFAGLYKWIAPVYNIGNAGTVTLTGIVAPEIIIGIFVIMGVVVLCGVEAWNPDNRKLEFSRIFANRGLIALLIFFIVGYIGLFLAQPVQSSRQNMQFVQDAMDHVEAVELVDALMKNAPDIVVIDVRSSEEYEQSHIPGALNISLAELEKKLLPYKGYGKIVLYSNGMTHPAQAREYLLGKGYGNIFILTDGFNGFLESIAKPLSLRLNPISAEDIARHGWWKSYVEHKKL